MKKIFAIVLTITTMLTFAASFTASGLNHNAQNEINSGIVMEKDGKLVLTLPVHFFERINAWLSCSINLRGMQYQEEEVNILIYNDHGKYDIIFEGSEAVTDRPFYIALKERVLNDDLEGLTPKEIVNGVFPEDFRDADVGYDCEFDVKRVSEPCKGGCKLVSEVAYKVNYYFYDSEQEGVIDSFQQAVKQCGVCNQGSIYDKLLVRATDPIVKCSCTARSFVNRNPSVNPHFSSPKVPD